MFLIEIIRCDVCVCVCAHARTREWEPAQMRGSLCKKKIVDFCYSLGYETHISCHIVTLEYSVRILLQGKVIMVINDFLR